MSWLVENVWLVPVYPLLAFTFIVLTRWWAYLQPKSAFANPKFSPVATIGATAIGLCHALALVAWLFAQPAESVHAIEVNFPWLVAGNLTFSMGYLVDAMSVMMTFVVTGISLFIQIYSHGYMSHDKGYCKFFAYLALFNFSMLGLVLSTNLFQMYIFWELVGVSSYLLIGFWFHKPSAAAANLKAFLMNRVGDFGLLIGVLSFLFFSFDWWTNYLSNHHNLAFLDFSVIGLAAPTVINNAGPVAFVVICFLIFMGPMAKSAQVPLHTWLPDAMEGPTPISALIHAATMVAAGIYLVGRMFPAFSLMPQFMAIIAGIGVITALMAATIALTQNDIKKALAYSTVSQLGFMMTAMGVGAFAAALFHLFTHAFFKAMLFLGSGSVIHACEDEQDMHKMGGLWSKLPITAWTYLIGTISISGLFWTSGYWSKDEILAGAFGSDQLLYWVLSFTAGLTSFYMFRTFFLTFTGQYRGQAHVHHETPSMVLPLVVLAVPSLFIGYLMSGMPSPLPAFGAYIHPPLLYTVTAHGAHHGHEIGWFTPVGVRSMIIGLTGALLAAVFYWEKSPVRLSAHWFVTQFPSYNVLFSKKYYFDELYQAFVDKVYLVFARGSSLFDKTALDGLVTGVATTVMGGGTVAKELQSGKVQLYLTVLFFGVAVLTLLAFYFWI
jgi:proton-translocating NADH-quinone oxidoreductase chain L